MSRKKTHEEYVKELAEKNPNVEVCEEYKGSNIKIMHHCLLHDVYWLITPIGALNGNGCEKCRKEKFHKKYVKSTKQYVNELKKINKNLEVIGEYIDAKTKITHHCLIHNIYFEQSPNNALNGKYGCKLCLKRKRQDAMAMSNEEYIKRVKEISPNISVVGKYVNMKTKILHRCNIHNLEWVVSPEKILNGCGCAKCGKEKYHKSRAKTTKEYIEEVKRINNNIEVLGEYISNRTPILHKCNIHNIEWNIAPYSILQGQGCYKCRNEKIAEKKQKTHEQYVEELKNINPNIIAVENYIDASTPILHKCLFDQCEWKARPANILFGAGCPQCNESNGERKIRLWLERNNITYEVQKKFDNCCDINPLPFDFYLPEHNISIEFDGKQHFEPIEYFGGQEKFEIQRKHDKIKDNFCKENGIFLLRIPYYKFKEIEEELNNFIFI